MKAGNMAKKEYEMPDEYKRNLAQLAEFLENRERFTKAMPDVPPHLIAEAKAGLRELDEAIEGMEKSLAKEYERYQSEKAKEEEISEIIARGWENSKRLYLIVKHQTPHLLEKFTNECLAPLTPDEREEFLDEVAVLEATKLDAILKGDHST